MVVTVPGDGKKKKKSNHNKKVLITGPNMEDFVLVDKDFVPPPPPPPPDTPSTGSIPGVSPRCSPSSSSAATPAAASIPGVSPRCQQPEEELPVPDGVQGEPLRGCVTCNAPAKASQLLIRGDTLEEQDWAGRLHAVCHQCSEFAGLDEKEFKKKCKAAWNKREIVLKGKAKRARGMTFKTVEERLQHLMPGATKAALRALVLQRLEAAALSVAAALTSNKFVAKASEAASADYLNTLDHCAKNPDFQRSTDSRTLSAQEAQYLTSIGPDTSFPFLCRFPDCMLAASNHMWIKKKTSEHFRCPKCFRMYQPWVEKGGKAKTIEMCKAQKAAFTVNPETQEKVVFLATWAASQDDGYFNNLLEIAARKIESEQDLEDYVQRKPQDLMLLLNNYVRPSHFQNFPLDVASCEAMVGSDWDWSHLLKTGYDGCVLTHMLGTPIFSQWEELAVLIANLAAKRK